MLDAVEQARAEEAAFFVGLFDVHFAGSELVYFLQEDDNCAKVAYAGEGAEEPASLALWVAGYIDTGVFVASCDLQVREGFAVDEVGVVLRADVLYQAGFLEDSVYFAGGFEIGNVYGFVDHLDDLWAARGEEVGGGLEIATCTGAEALGLADI